MFNPQLWDTPSCVSTGLRFDARFSSERDSGQILDLKGGDRIGHEDRSDGTSAARH
jgi:hypothetical protein